MRLRLFSQAPTNLRSVPASQLPTQTEKSLMSLWHQAFSGILRERYAILYGTDITIEGRRIAPPLRGNGGKPHEDVQ